MDGGEQILEGDLMGGVGQGQVSDEGGIGRADHAVGVRGLGGAAE